MDNRKKTGVLLQICQLGKPILRKKAKEVKNIKDKNVQELIDNLIATVLDVDGVGIAATQVYQPLRIFILASHPNPRYPKAPKMQPEVIINPQIISTSPKKTKDWEGCLSIPQVRGLVPRYNSIELEYLTRDGKKEKKVFKGFVARIVQHEYDHIEGKVFLDRLDSTFDIVTEKEYQKIIARK